jgi:hypothetical protein
MIQDPFCYINGDLKRSLFNSIRLDEVRFEQLYEFD